MPQIVQVREHHPEIGVGSSKTSLIGRVSSVRRRGSGRAGRRHRVAGSRRNSLERVIADRGLAVGEQIGACFAQATREKRGENLSEPRPVYIYIFLEQLPLGGRRFGEYLRPKLKQTSNLVGTQAKGLFLDLFIVLWLQDELFVSPSGLLRAASNAPQIEAHENARMSRGMAVVSCVSQNLKTKDFMPKRQVFRICDDAEVVNA